MRVSGPMPGAVHDLTAARIRGTVAELAASGLIVLADNGYASAGEHARVPYKGKNKPRPQRTPTALMPGCATPSSAPIPSSRPGGSCASSTAALGAPASWPRRSPSFTVIFGSK